MSSNKANTIGSLDIVRLNRGIDVCKKTFQEIGNNNRIQAIRLINDKRLQFTSLFILIPEIEALNLHEYLNARNIIALKACSIILKDKHLTDSDVLLYIKSKKSIIQTLKWMITTGATEDGLSNAYDEVLDGTASLLLNTFKDRTILTILADMIFNRNRKGLFIHNLVWTFFQAHETDALKIIAAYLRSSEQKDVELACKFLNISRFDDSSRGQDNQSIYISYIAWLNENNPFIFFTAESLQLTSYPQFVKVDLAAKYLCKSIIPHNGKPIKRFTDKERNHLEHFNMMDEEQKVILSKYSRKLHTHSMRMWNKWMLHSINEQMNIVSTDLRGVL